MNNPPIPLVFKHVKGGHTFISINAHAPDFCGLVQEMEQDLCDAVDRASRDAVLTRFRQQLERRWLARLNMAKVDAFLGAALRCAVESIEGALPPLGRAP